MHPAFHTLPRQPEVTWVTGPSSRSGTRTVEVPPPPLTSNGTWISHPTSLHLVSSSARQAYSQCLPPWMRVQLNLKGVREVASAQAPRGRKAVTFPRGSGEDPAQNLRARRGTDQSCGLETLLCICLLGSKAPEILCLIHLHCIRASLSSSPAPSPELQTHVQVSKHVKPYRFKSKHMILSLQVSPSRSSPS